MTPRCSAFPSPSQEGVGAEPTPFSIACAGDVVRLLPSPSTFLSPHPPHGFQSGEIGNEGVLDPPSHYGES